ncbi:hypothetical protein H261_20422 [Paramagnetospirillum caucaseum]|uniref:Uncharacterized protein n=1 Tax=Paramagnetospirillum caucaseum TaxID=1244869 RepID=M2Y4N4_9PROT|nr:DUF6626 family protein [Paramagnetospirillum caucaseum]EME68046.1 hypothetical protein H261_20422 [Paramagnetospirillum caucaseum]
MLLEKVYGELRDMWMVESQYEFSRFWLGQSRSYMSCAKARQRPPSLLVLMRLSQRLASISAKYAAVATTEMEKANTRKLHHLNRMVGDALGRLASVT